MRVNVCFQLKKGKCRETDGKCPLYVRCTLNGQRFEVSSGIFIVNDSWSDALQLIKGKTEEIKALNIRLEKIKTKIRDIHNQLESSGEPFDIM